MGNGTDVAIESADIVLMGGDLAAAPRAFALARRTMRIIKENLFWAFFYNVVCIPLAAGCFAWADVMLNPMYAAAAITPCGSPAFCGKRRKSRRKPPNKEILQ